MTCGNAEEVLEGRAAGDGECGEFVLREKLLRAVAAVLAFGSGDGNGFVGAVFQGEDGSRKVRCAVCGLLGEGACGVGRENERWSCGGGVEQKTAARWHDEIVGW